MAGHPSSAIRLLSLLVLVGGCTGVEKPTASVRGMDITDVAPRGFTMAIDLDVHNPNSVALPLTDADYSLSLGGVGVIESTKVPPTRAFRPTGRAG